MNSQEKQGYIDEINYQKKMIHNLINGYAICSSFPLWESY